MATVSKSGSSRRKREAPGKIKILMNGSSGKVVHSDSENDIADESIPEDLPEGTVIVEPQAVEDAPSKKKKEVPNRIDTSVLDNINCTACGRQLNPHKNSAIQKHPELKVVICKKCEKFLSSGDIAKDKDGIDEQCRWCGEGGRLVVCDECASAFCKACVMRNFNRSEFNNINDQESWKCYLCDKSQLQGLRENYRKIRDTLKSLQAKQRAKEQLNGDKDKVSAGASSSRSNGRKAAGPGSSTDAHPLKNAGPQSTASGTTSAVRDSDLALTVDDLAVDHMYVDVIMDKLSTSTNTFKEMLRALRSQFHSTSPRAVDEAPPMFQFSFSASMDINTKKQRCAKALNKGLITYLQSLRKILHKGSSEDKSKSSPSQKKSNAVSVIEDKGSDHVSDTEKTDKNTALNRKEASGSNVTQRGGEGDKNKGEKGVDDRPKVKTSQKKSDVPETSRLSRDQDRDKRTTLSSNVKSSSKGEKKAQSSDKGKSRHEKEKTANEDKNEKGQAVQEASKDLSEKETSKDVNKKETSKDVSKKETSKDVSEEETSKDVSKKETSKDVSEKETSKDVSKKETSKDVSEKETSKDISEKEKSKDVSEKETSKDVSEEETSKDVSEKETSKDVSEKETSKDISEKEKSQCDFNIDDEENVAAKLDLIQELAEEMLKDNSPEDEANKITDKETPCESEEEEECLVSNGSGMEMEDSENEGEKQNRKRKVSNADKSPIKGKKKTAVTFKDPSNDEEPSQAKGKELKSSDEEDGGRESVQGEDASSPDPLSSDEENERSHNRKKKRKAVSKEPKESVKPKAKNGNVKDVKEKKTGKLNISSKMFSAASQSKEKKEEKKTEKATKSKEEISSLDKEIDQFSKLPTIQKRKRKAESEEDSEEAKNDEKKVKTAKKSKPGPKSSKKDIDLDELSSDPDDQVDDDVDEDSNEEDDDMEPQVTFFVGEPEGEKKGTPEENENELAKKRLLEESDEEENSDRDSDNSSDSGSDLSDTSEKSKKKRKAKNDKDSKQNSNDEIDASDQSNDEGNDSEDNIGKKNKRIRSKLLDAKLSDSDSDAKNKKGKKKDKEYTKEDSSGSSLESDSSDNDDESDLEEEDSEEDEDKPKKSKKKGKKKGRKGKGKKKKGASDDEDEEEEEEGKKGKGKKRRRIKKMKNSSDEDQSDDDDDPNSSKAGKRKQIRKVMSKNKLEDATKAAAKAEEKRRKRIAAKQREFNVETITDENNPMNCPITTKLILEPGKEEGEDPIVQVNKKLIRKLKPHQVEAVQFMWDCMFESVKRSKKETGAGCILAHCMGLGKTLSVISFVHTILSHEKALKMRTCLVVCPLNTVLNWRNEWTMWLDKKDQFEVWELASCKQNAARSEALREWQESGGIMIMGYEMYRNLTASARIKNKRQKKAFQECLVDPGPDIVVCDEGHILKNENSTVSKAMNLMKTRRRVVLTGTPLQNNLNEYHCMVSFVKPNLLGTRKEFNNRFISPIQNGQCTDSTPRDVKIMKARAHVLHEMLAGCVQRRDYSALTKFLPPKQEYVISVRLTEVQIELYEKYLSLTTQGSDGMFNNKGARLFKDYQNLMKIWTHPWVLKLAEIRDEMKMKFDDEDSFIDDDTEDERSFSSSESSSNEDKKCNSDSGGEGMSLGPHSKRGTRRTRAKARRQAGEDSDPEEVIAEWKSKSRNEDDDAKPPAEPDKSVSNDWWAQFVTEDDKQKMELSNKLYLLFEILRMCEEIGDKVLIFSQSILSLNIIESFLETIDSKFQNELDSKAEDEETKEDEAYGKCWTKNLDYYRMDGSTSAQNRQMWAQNFNDMDNYRARLFLISTKAGGLGINLVAANRVIIFDASWNPSHDVQSIFRVYRFGQIKPCYIYRFLAQGTMEEKIYERQVTKLSLSQRVVDEHQIERHFSANDLKELYNFRPEHWDDEAKKQTLALPKDPLLAEILKSQRHCVVSFHEHDSLLENQVEQTLTEEEKKAAWEEYENEKKGIIIRGPGMDSMNRTASWPMMAAAQILSREQITATVQALRQQLPNLPEEMFHLHVQQALRRQVQMKQEEMRRMELMRMQEMTYINMMQQEAERGGLSHGIQSMQNMQNLAPWMQMQRLRAMQNHYMQQNLGGAYNVAGMSPSAGNNPDEPIDLDESPAK